MLLDIFKKLYKYVFPSAHLIIPRLWLGDCDAAADISFITENNIDVIVNCTPDLPFVTSDLETYRIPVYDSQLEKDILLMQEYFSITLPILTRAYLQNKTIFIHCYAGKQRSGILVAAFLKYLLDRGVIQLNTVKSSNPKTQFEQISNYIQSKRPQVFTYGYRVNFKRTYERFFNYNDM
jgi:protein-tyrosine phosphatase